MTPTSQDTALADQLELGAAILREGGEWQFEAIEPPHWVQGEDSSELLECLSEGLVIRRKPLELLSPGDAPKFDRWADLRAAKEACPEMVFRSRCKVDGGGYTDWLIISEPDWTCDEYEELPWWRERAALAEGRSVYQRDRSDDLGGFSGWYDTPENPEWDNPDKEFQIQPPPIMVPLTADDCDDIQWISAKGSQVKRAIDADAFKERLRQLAEKWEKEAKELVVDYNDVGLARILALEQCVRQLRELLDKP